MKYTEFVYSLAKMLQEDLPLSFKVQEDGYDVPIIKITPDKDFSEYTSFPEPCYIGIDDLGDSYEIYIRVGSREYKNFGKIERPEQVFQEIEKYLYSRFDSIILRQKDNDFVFSADLKDFLNSNGILAYPKQQDNPDLVVMHPSQPFQYFISFSEYRGDVLVTMTEYVPSKKSYYRGTYYSGDDTEIYRSALNNNNQKNVFTDILSLLRKNLNN